MKTLNAQQALELTIVETKLNCEFKQIDIDGKYAATVGIKRSIPTFENLLDPFVHLSNGLQVEFDPKIELFRSKFGTEGASYAMSMPLGKIELGGRETETRIIRRGSFNSSASDSFGIEMMVMICSNGMMGWKAESESGRAKSRFSLNWEVNAGNKVDAMLHGFHSMQDRYIRIANELKEIKLSKEQVDNRLEKLFGKDSKQSDRVREQVQDLFVSGKGNRGENAWDLFNAVTEYQNHERTYKVTSVSSDENRRKGILDIDFDTLAEVLVA